MALKFIFYTSWLKLSMKSFDRAKFVKSKTFTGKGTTWHVSHQEVLCLKFVFVFTFFFFIRTHNFNKKTEIPKLNHSLVRAPALTICGNSEKEQALLPNDSPVNMMFCCFYYMFSTIYKCLSVLDHFSTYSDFNNDRMRGKVKQ